MRWQKVRLCCLALVRTTPGAVILRLRRLFLSSSSEKPIHLRPWARLGGTRVVPWLAVAMRRRLNALPILSAAGSGCFECAVLRRSIPNERGKFHLALDQVRCFKSSVEHQTPRVPPDVAEHKFHGTRERHRVFFAPAPFCLRRRSAPPNLGSRIEQIERAFSVALRVKAKGAVVFIRKSDLDVPPANQVRRLCVGHDGAACIHD